MWTSIRVRNFMGCNLKGNPIFLWALPSEDHQVLMVKIQERVPHSHGREMEKNIYGKE